MAWFTRVSRFGDVHAVFGQETRYSCGVACVIMAAFKIHKIKPNSITPNFLSEERIRAKAEAHKDAPKQDLEKNGFNSEVIKDLLNDPDLRMPGWDYKKIEGGRIPEEIIAKVGVTHRIGPVLTVNPVIVNIQWDYNDQKHGVLIDTVRNVFGRTYATVCDPSDAHVHVIELRDDTLNDRYIGGNLALGANFWGKRPLRRFTPEGFAAEGIPPEFITPQGIQAKFTGTIFWRDTD